MKNANTFAVEGRLTDEAVISEADSVNAVGKEAVISQSPEGSQLGAVFLQFVEATKALEISQQSLSAEVHRLTEDLAKSNANLKQQIEAKGRIAEELAALLSALPTGVIILQHGKVYAFNEVSSVVAPWLKVGVLWGTPKSWTAIEENHYKISTNSEEHLIIRSETRTLADGRQMLLLHDATATFRAREEADRQESIRQEEARLRAIEEQRLAEEEAVRLQIERQQQEAEQARIEEEARLAEERRIAEEERMRAEQEQAAAPAPEPTPEPAPTPITPEDQILSQIQAEQDAAAPAPEPEPAPAPAPAAPTNVDSKGRQYNPADYENVKKQLTEQASAGVNHKASFSSNQAEIIDDMAKQLASYGVKSIYDLKQEIYTDLEYPTTTTDEAVEPTEVQKQRVINSATGQEIPLNELNNSRGSGFTYYKIEFAMFDAAIPTLSNVVVAIDHNCSKKYFT